MVDKCSSSSDEFTHALYATSDHLVHIITDEDIENRTSFAVKIGAVTDAARSLQLGKGGESSSELDGGD